MERNVQLLNKVMDFIEEHPRQHKQKYIWLDGTLERLLGKVLRRPECGSAGCFAGWAVHFSSEVSRWSNPYMVIERATLELGLTRYEAEWMFAPDRNRKELRVFVDKLTVEQATRDARRRAERFERDLQQRVVEAPPERVLV